MPEVPRYLENTDEVEKPQEFRFTNELPEWVAGTLYSSAPGVFDLEKSSVNNWFDGYAILSKFQISRKQLTFKSKYLNSHAYRKAKENGRPIMPEFATPAFTSKKKFFSKLLPFGPYDISDNVLGRIFKLGPNMYTAGDSCYLHEIDPASLETLETFHVTKTLAMSSISCQPIEDYQSGDIYAIGCSLQPTFRYSVLKMSPADKDNSLDKRFSVLSSFASRWMFGACPCRNFAMTENYIIMIEMPLVLNLMKIASTYVKGYSASDWLDWRPDDGVKFYIVKKADGKLLRTEVFASEAFLAPSIINSYESHGEIIIDLITMPDLDCQQATALTYLRNLPASRADVAVESKSGTVQRFIIPVIEDIEQHPEGRCLLNPANKQISYSRVKAERKAGKLVVTPEDLSVHGRGLDFDAINPNYRGKNYTFVYNTAGYISNSFSHAGYGVSKLNVHTKQVDLWQGIPGQAVSEPVFIPNPKSDASEDDGILLTLVKVERSHEQDDFLLVLDAKSMKEISRAYIKCPVAGWFHANYFRHNSTESI